MTGSSVCSRIAAACRSSSAPRQRLGLDRRRGAVGVVRAGLEQAPERADEPVGHVEDVEHLRQRREVLLPEHGRDAGPLVVVDGGDVDDELVGEVEARLLARVGRRSRRGHRGEAELLRDPVAHRRRECRFERRRRRVVGALERRHCLGGVDASGLELEPHQRVTTYPCCSRSHVSAVTASARSSCFWIRWAWFFGSSSVKRT